MKISIQVCSATTETYKGKDTPPITGASGHVHVDVYRGSESEREREGGREGGREREKESEKEREREREKRGGNENSEMEETT